MASSGLLAPAALGYRVRRRGQPSVSVSICRGAVQGGSPHQQPLSQSSLSIETQHQAIDSHSPDHTLKLCGLTNSRAGRQAGAENKSRTLQATAGETHDMDRFRFFTSSEGVCRQRHHSDPKFQFFPLAGHGDAKAGKSDRRLQDGQDKEA